MENNGLLILFTSTFSRHFIMLLSRIRPQHVKYLWDSSTSHVICDSYLWNSKTCTSQNSATNGYQICKHECGFTKQVYVCTQEEYYIKLKV